MSFMRAGTRILRVPEGMPVSWETEEPRRETRKWSRRDFVKVGLVAGAASVASIAVAETLLRTPPSEDAGSVILYTEFPQPAWWNSKAGTPMKVTDFGVWEGASGVVNAVLASGRPVPGTGMPVLVVRIPRDDTNFSSPPPSEFPLAGGFALYYDNTSTDTRTVAVYDRCAHLCCSPGWHVITNPPPERDYVNASPTYQVYNQDPVYCICHGSQYDPMVLVKNVNPTNGITYVGAEMVHGPAQRAIPVLALKAIDDVLHGLEPDPKWYADC